MEARLLAAHRGLIGLLFVTLAVLPICLPRPGDARVARGYAELSEFQRSVDLAATEQTRRAQAMQFAQVPLQELAAPAPGPEAARGALRERSGKVRARWQVADGAPALAPLANLRLVSLGDVSAQSQGAAQAEVALPRADAVQAALAFRLARLGATGTPTITGAVLEAAELGAEDVQREFEVRELEREVAEARVGLERAERRREFAEKRVEARKKRRSRSTDKFRELLTTALQQRDEKAAVYEALQTRYEALAEQVMQGSAAAPMREAGAELPRFARLRVSLEGPPAEPRELTLAVELERRLVSLPPLVIPGAQASFPALHAADLWQELAPLAPTPALETVRARLSWQVRPLSALGIPVEGSWVLQALPWLVVLALLVACRRAVGAASSHRLFGAQPRGNLPQVGFKKRSYELLVTVVLPLGVCLLAGISLWLLRRLPLSPAVAFTVCAPLSLRLFAKLDELRVLNRSILQYHSYPPPALAAEAELEGGAA
ncbi:MAG: hypothetical protein QM778_13765 [Myxococcales bacterium]